MGMVEFYLLMALFLRLQAVLCIVPRVLCSVTGDRPFLTALLVDVRVWCAVVWLCAAGGKPSKIGAAPRPPKVLILLSKETGKRKTKAMFQ